MDDYIWTLFLDINILNCIDCDIWLVRCICLVLKIACWQLTHISCSWMVVYRDKFSKWYDCFLHTMLLICSFVAYSISDMHLPSSDFQMLLEWMLSSWLGIIEYRILTLYIIMFPLLSLLGQYRKFPTIAWPLVSYGTL